MIFGSHYADDYGEVHPSKFRNCTYHVSSCFGWILKSFSPAFGWGNWRVGLFKIKFQLSKDSFLRCHNLHNLRDFAEIRFLISLYILPAMLQSWTSTRTPLLWLRTMSMPGVSRLLQVLAVLTCVPLNVPAIDTCDAACQNKTSSRVPVTARYAPSSSLSTIAAPCLKRRRRARYCRWDQGGEVSFVLEDSSL